MAAASSRRDIVRVVVQHLLDEPKHRDEWLKRLAAYIVAHNLVDKVDLIVNDIAHELHKQAGIVTVEVVSARELTAAMRKSLEKLLRDETDAKALAIHESIDESLVGGFVARTADAEIDASVKTKLKALAALA